MIDDDKHGLTDYERGTLAALLELDQLARFRRSNEHIRLAHASGADPGEQRAADRIFDLRTAELFTRVHNGLRVSANERQLRKPGDRPRRRRLQTKKRPK